MLETVFLSLNCIVILYKSWIFNAEIKLSILKRIMTFQFLYKNPKYFLVNKKPFTDTNNFINKSMRQKYKVILKKEN